MKRTLTLLLGATMLMLAIAAPAAAKSKPDFNTPREPAVECLKAGQKTLKSLGLFQAAAMGEINYALIDSNGPGISALELPGGLIGADLGDEALLPLSTVFQLHLDSPGLFAWCDA